MGKVARRTKGDARQEEQEADAHCDARVARLRLEIAQEIGRLNLTERARQRLINAIRGRAKRSARSRARNRQF